MRQLRRPAEPHPCMPMQGWRAPLPRQAARTDPAWVSSAVQVVVGRGNVYGAVSPAARRRQVMVRKRGYCLSPHRNSAP
jgi:hypothetical protein